MILYSLTIFLSAFLLFLVQLLIGKLILPWFGGSSAVWSTQMLFFQSLLTGGYAYACWLVNDRSPKRKRTFHILLLVLSLPLLSLLAALGGTSLIPVSSLHPASPDTPVWNLLKLLSLVVGLPAFLLSATSVLIQSWFSVSDPDRNPYSLYALSNTGSLLALASYPTLIEPTLTLSTQIWIWSGLFVLFTISLIILTSRAPQLISQIVRDRAADQESREGPSNPDRRPVLWVALSTAGSILLLSVTSRITQEVAPVPLLWTLPLVVYLATFILSFSGERFYRRGLAVTLLALSSAAVLFEVLSPRLGFLPKLMIHLVFLFAACWAAHGELYRLRPAPASLPHFYLWVSAGGALGGAAVSLAAPLVFKDYWEFFLGWALVLALVLVLVILPPGKKHRLPFWKTRSFRNALQLVLSLGLVLAAVLNHSQDQLFAGRNFYGISQVTYSDFRDSYQYVNGQTVHGYQPVSASKRSLPTAYFWRGSGIGILIHNHPGYGKGMKIGVLGLGIGTLAAYGQPGDRVRFYEIDPLVIELASGKWGFFSYLKDSQAEIEIVPGDARLSLEGELARGQAQDFDLLVMDAFSSDSVPTHLITREAFETYLEHLGPEGVIAVNISNNYIDLKPVIWTLARELELETILIDPPVQAYHPLATASRWMFLIRDPTLLERTEIKANADFLDSYSSDIQLWTDNFSNLFPILR